MVWYSHLFQNFPQFIVIHTVKGFDIVNKAEIDVILELSCFFHDPADVGNLISGSSASIRFCQFLLGFVFCRFYSHSCFMCCFHYLEGFPGGSDGKGSACNAGDLGLIPGSSAFSKTSLNIWKFMVYVLLKPFLENFEHYFASV